MFLQLECLTCSPDSSTAKATAKSGSSLLSMQSATPLINDPWQYATSVLSALWPLGYSGAGRDAQEAHSLKDLVSLIVHQLLYFNPLLLRSNLQPKPKEYSDFSFCFWRMLKWVLPIRASSGPMGLVPFWWKWVGCGGSVLASGKGGF